MDSGPLFVCTEIPPRQRGMEMTDFSLETVAGENGVFVVVERHPVSPEHIIGTACSLYGAMMLTLDAAGFEMLVPKGSDENKEWYNAVPVDSNHPDAPKHFRWHDEQQIGKYPSKFQKGYGTLTAYFQDECSAFYVHWTEYTNR